MSSYLPPEQAVATMKREPFFKCVYSSERSEYSFHFRAWSAEEAEAHLRTELKTFAVNAAGEIRVLHLRDGSFAGARTGRAASASVTMS